jgi:Zn-dependent protease
MSWKLGRVAGIDVFLHPTFLLLLAFGLLRGGFESVVFVSAVFGCVLLHELGHALMARRFGIETQDITLYPIGGVARLERMPRAPGAELLIALAGPAVNLVIVLALSLASPLGLLGEASRSPGLFALFVDQLILVNMVLALFNLIPAFPMDGGRVLRALLSGWIGRARATMIAATIGRGLALAFGVYCLSQLWLLQAILAGFIYLAAGQELDRVLVEERGAPRRRPGWPHDPSASQGVWTAPAGFHWVSRGDGVWQLAPIRVQARPTDRGAPWA